MQLKRAFNPNEFFKVGIEGFVVEDNKLLLGKRINVPGDQTWGLPGGHLEKGEELEACLARELKEECDITVVQSSFLVFTNDPHNISGHYLHVGFNIDKFTGEIKNMEPDKCAEWKFFPISELPENIFPPHQKNIELFLAHKTYEA